MTFAIYKQLRSAALLFFSIPMVMGLLFGSARAAEAGWRPYEVPPSITNPEKIPVALYYPTQALTRSIIVGSSRSTRPPWLLRRQRPKASL
ncbi:hypothetical protein PY650_26235 [Rhizobium calliandrae]|uniref:Uncharacterized protein n=1 Tax=Rhizobium calliandrae TaxID=1312182 RepID=A0ABT7KP78_9HYPH|nr:hypothetical protein [Rhizobium calliandrae]MDL2409073.1 hypothetical protein [Rhizobium calliandrae]